MKKMNYVKFVSLLLCFCMLSQPFAMAADVGAIHSSPQAMEVIVLDERVSALLVGLEPNDMGNIEIGDELSSILRASMASPENLEAQEDSGLLSVFFAYVTYRTPAGVFVDLLNLAIVVSAGIRIIDAYYNGDLCRVFQGTGYENDGGVLRPVVDVNDGVPTWY